VDECLICFSEFWDIIRFRLFSGGYNLVTTEEFKQLIDSGEDTDSGYHALRGQLKKQHVPGADQFPFPIPDMKEWDTKETDGNTLEDYKNCWVIIKTSRL
jgi:hypothetical protein